MSRAEFSSIGRLALAFLALLGLAGEAQAGLGSPPAGIDTTVFQNGVSPTTGFAGIYDTFLSSAAADSGKNYGASDSLVLAGTAAADGKGSRIILLRLDPGTYLTGKTIHSVEVFFYQTGEGSFGSDPGGFATTYAVARSWVEGTKRGANQVGAADWRDAGLTRWYSAAGPTALPDISQADFSAWRSKNLAASDTSVSAPAWTGTDSLDVSKWGALSFDRFGYSVADWNPKPGMTWSPTPPIQEIRGWVGFQIQPLGWKWIVGSNANRGLAILYGELTNNCDASWTDAYRFYSSNYAQKAYRPKVVVSWSDPSSSSAATDQLGIGGGIGKD